MSYELNDNSGSLFASKNKKTDKHPDREGSAKIGGRDYWVSGWIKQDRNGKPWLSLSFKLKDQQQPAEQKPSNAPQKPRSMKDTIQNDEIPF